MQSSGQKKLPFKFKQGAITEWMELIPAMSSGRMSMVLESIETFACKYTLLPKEEDVFNMFRMIYPGEVKVVFVGQSPYPGCCPVTHIPYACGPAFMPTPGCVTTPATLKNIVSEVCRDFGKSIQIPPNDMLNEWVNQGTMLLNSSLTLGSGCPKYLEDHSVTWEEIMREILSTIYEKLDPIFILVGRDAWKFESCLGNDVIKVSHPVARKETSTPWIKSSVFSNVSRMLVNKELTPIRWV